MSETNDPSKKDLRAEMRKRLAAMSEQERRDASVLACDRLMSLEAFTHAGTVMLFMPLAREVDVTPVAIRCFQTGRTVCVPRVDWDRRDMSAIEVQSFDDRVMDVDEHGVRSPREGRLVIPTMIDLIVLPGLAFDPQGNRLGRGAGFYDRFLAKLSRVATRVAIAFDRQIVDQVPFNDRDATVDVIVTDRRLTRTGNASARR